MTLKPSAQIIFTAEFEEALYRLRNRENLFLTGKAGTGKSTLIRTFLGEKNGRALVVAPTGIAALNVGGYTIHRLFSFGKDTTVDYVKSADYFPRRFAKAIKELDTLIIDEASMVRADLFDCMAIALKRFGPNPDLPFGGIQVVLVGDLFQLPPVVVDSEKEFFVTTYDSPYFFSATNYSPQMFPSVQLTKVFRQVGDSKFVELLNQVREGAMLDTARAELNICVEEEFEPPLDEFWLTLTTTNRSADKRNAEMLAKLPGQAETFTSLEQGDFDGFEKPAEDQVSYKPGAQIMMLTNDQSDRWVNGTIGKIISHTFKDGEPLIRVHLADGRKVQVGPYTWDVTRPVAQGGSLTHEVIGTYTQLPFRLAWAITIHKSQGQTLERVVVDLTGGTFAYGQLYVALSRCTSLEGLILSKPIAPRDLQVDQRIRRFLHARSHSDAALENVYLGVCTVGEEGRMWRPRPVEIALVTDDGIEVSTLINPTMDLGFARSDYGIVAGDVQFAPTLVQAWPALAPFLAGRTPVGVGIDRILSHIDYELKRHEYVVSMPLGIDLAGSIDLARASDSGVGNMPQASAGIRGKTALERARATRDLFWQGAEAHGSGQAFYAAEPLPGFLLPRPTEAVTFLLGGISADGSSLEQDLVKTLRELARDKLGDGLAVRLLRGVETVTGQEILPPGTGGTEFSDAAHQHIEKVLEEGAVVCFTGTVLDSRGYEIDREVLEDLARARGLRPEPTVTKSRLTALVVAESGTQSNKAKAAARFGKPIFTAAEFLAWAEERSRTVGEKSQIVGGNPQIFGEADGHAQPVPAHAQLDQNGHVKVQILHAAQTVRQQDMQLTATPSSN